jgi:hypothetical protein
VKARTSSVRNGVASGGDERGWLESSDYGICHCPDCGAHYYEREFAFVRGISEDVWRVRTNAMIVVYPHYFTGKKVPGLDATAARQIFDPRWNLFFTPHSAHFDSDLLRQARSAIFWGDSPILGTPRGIQTHAQTARQNGMTGFLPSLGRPVWPDLKPRRKANAQPGPTDCG